MAEEIKAGVVVVTKFVSPASKKFQSYINYIDRADAVRDQHLADYAIDELRKEVPAFNRYMEYMGNPEKAEGLFTAEKDLLTQEEKKKIKNIFAHAQKKESLMWQTVISFDNRFLAAHGIYDESTHIVDKKKLQEYTRGCMSRMLQREGIKESSIWCASVHYNTDNIHIHIATVEPVPTRKKIQEGKYAGQYRGKFKQSSIEAGKSFIVNQILNTAEQNQKINNIIRQNMVQGKRERPLIKDKRLCKQFLQLYYALPENRQLWKYNMNGIAHLRPQIDEISRSYIERYHHQDFLELQKMVQEQEAQQRVAYGEKSRGGYAEGKIKDLYARMGNTILKEALQYDRDMKQTLRVVHVRSTAVKGKSIGIKREIDMAASDIEKAVRQMQYGLKSDFEHYRNQLVYKNEIEKQDTDL